MQQTRKKRDRRRKYVVSDLSQVIYCGGYSGGVPPLPIPNREVKPAIADGTAPPGGRVGSCRSSKGSDSKRIGALFANVSCLCPSLPTPFPSSGGEQSLRSESSLFSRISHKPQTVSCLCPSLPSPLPLLGRGAVASLRVLLRSTQVTEDEEDDASAAVDLDYCQVLFCLNVMDLCAADVYRPEKSLPPKVSFYGS